MRLVLFAHRPFELRVRRLESQLVTEAARRKSRRRGCYPGYSGMVLTECVDLVKIEAERICSYTEFFVRR
jgi:hypothetical protein